jgi:3-oxoacyl-[acyl-carrier protein] reductase
MRLDGKVALVTGASRGIGAATARLLAREGAKVCVNYRASEQAARQVVAAIEAEGGRAVAVRADVTEHAEVEFLVQSAEQELGPLDVLVANAGMGVHLAPFLAYPWEEFEAKLLGEARAVFFVAQAAARSMVARRSGAIVVVSSGLSRQPGDGFCAHSAAKAALDGFVRALAHELGPDGVRVNTVAPGLTLTDATAFLPEAARARTALASCLRRNAQPEDVAGAILALVADTGRHVTGVYLPVDGGVVMP